MSVRNNLQHELLKCILGNIGFVPPPYFGKVGISHNVFKTNEVVKISYDDEIVEYPVFSAKVGWGQESLSVLGTRINEKDLPDEFTIVYRIDNTNINAIRANFSNYNNMLFLMKDKSWKDASMYNKLIATAGFERLASIGLDWKENEVNMELLSSLYEICEM